MDRTGVDLEIAFARSRRAAVARHAGATRRASLTRLRSRLVVGLLVLLVGLLAGTASAKAPVESAPKGPGWTVARCLAAGRFLPAFRAASLDTTLPVSLLVAVAWEESRMHENAVSPVGARGVLQLMPATARIMAVHDAGARTNIIAGARYLHRMLDRFGGRLDLALSAYNAGPSAVARAGAAPTIGTLRYALNIEARYERLASCG